MKSRAPALLPLSKAVPTVGGAGHTQTLSAVSALRWFLAGCWLGDHIGVTWPTHTAINWRLKAEPVHAHPHSGGDGTRTPNAQRVLKLAMIATGAYIILLVIAGWKAHSLALLSEAGHNLSDFLALALS